MPAVMPLKVTQLSSTAGELREFGSDDYVSLSQGGTGVSVSTLADLRTALGLKSAALADLVGVVGNNSGATVQTISTSNGVAERFPSGLQICTIRTVATLSAASNAVQAAYTWTFPAPFTSVHAGSWAPLNFGGGELITWLRLNNNSTASCSLKNTGLAISGGYDITAMVIGRWS